MQGGRRGLPETRRWCGLVERENGHRRSSCGWRGAETIAELIVMVVIATVGVVKQLISSLPCNQGTAEAIQGDSNDDWDSLLTSSPLVIIQGSSPL